MKPSPKWLEFSATQWRLFGKQWVDAVLRFVVLRRGVIPASRGGKLKTLVQAVAIGLFVLPLSGGWLVVGWVIMSAAVVLTVLTGLDYFVSAVRDWRGRPADH